MYPVLLEHVGGATDGLTVLCLLDDKPGEVLYALQGTVVDVVEGTARATEFYNTHQLCTNGTLIAALYREKR